MAPLFTFHHLAHIFGVLGNIVSFLVFLSPSPTLYKMYEARATLGFNPLPYSVALFSCMLTGYYGLVKHNMLLITINVVGIVVESFYLAIYMVFAPIREKLSTMKLLLPFNVGLLGIIILLTTLTTHGAQRETTVGWICAICSVCVFVSPFSVMKTVIMTKSVEFVPFWLSFSLTGCAIIWFFYGFFVRDLFVALPNVLGFIFGVVQMTLYFVYKNSKKKPAEEKDAEKATEFCVVDVLKLEASGNPTEEEIKRSSKCSVENNAANGMETLDNPPVLECIV